MPSNTVTYRGRFAPSPTGDLHFGSLIAALGSFLDARAHEGAWIVRIEDVDETRAVAGSEARILATLAAFGMTSDEPVVRQSARKALYEAVLAELLTSGEAFACFCSRAALGATLHHRCVAAPAAERTPAFRVRAPAGEIAFVDRLQGPQRQDLSAEVGDFVVKRADGFFAYQLAVVVDDAEQGITDVVRGADLLDSTARQIHLQRKLGYTTPRYLHLPLAVDAYGRKLSKQFASAPVDADDPLPALRHALGFLGFDAAVLQAPSVRALLRDAVRDYDVARLRAVAAMRATRSCDGMHDALHNVARLPQ